VAKVAQKIIRKKNPFFLRFGFYNHILHVNFSQSPSAEFCSSAFVIAKKWKEYAICMAVRYQLIYPNNAIIYRKAFPYDTQLPSNTKSAHMKRIKELVAMRKLMGTVNLSEDLDFTCEIK